MADLKKILQEFGKVVGPQNVHTDERSINEVQTATFAIKRKVDGIVYPKDTDEVVKCVKLANKHKVPLYPVSRGRNIGHGSRVPSCDNAIVLSFERMSKILEYDDKLGFITIEPGVTQQQVLEFLGQNKSSFMLGPTGSARDSSVVGNVLERGDGTGVQSERIDYYCNAEVVLGTGEVIQSGIGRFANAKCASLDKSGLGPRLDSMFVQSNFGIITRMTLWLEPIANFIHNAVSYIHDENKLPDLIDAAFVLHMQGIMPNVLIWNDYKVFSNVQQYPFDLTQKTPLPQDVRLQLRKKHQIGAWNLICPLYSFSEEQAQAKYRLFAGLLQPFTDAGNVSVIKGSTENTIHDILLSLDDNLNSVYWRKKNPIPKELKPEDDNCGLIWFNPLIPFRGADAAWCAQTATAICLKYGFEPQIVMVGSRPRALKFIVSISYDRDIKGEDSKAMKCHDELLQKFTKQGYYPYRLGIQTEEWAKNDDSSYMQLVRQIKKIVDPNNVIAPDRYGI